jgi:hypothetical protein
MAAHTLFSDVYCSEVHCVLCPATPPIALPRTFSIAAALLLLVQTVVYLVHVHVGCSHPALWSAACTAASHLGCCPFTPATALPWAAAAITVAMAQAGVHLSVDVPSSCSHTSIILMCQLVLHIVRVAL